jgi:hypothetical protein
MLISASAVRTTSRIGLLPFVSRLVEIPDLENGTEHRTESEANSLESRKAFIWINETLRASVADCC